MNLVLNSTLVQVFGTAIILGVVFQVALMLVSSWQKVRFERGQQDLTSELLRERVRAETLHRQLEEDQKTHTWSGSRKFRIQRKVMECDDVCSVYLVPHDGKPLPPFEPGQYLTFQLKLADRDTPLVRCYSLSGSPFQREHYRVTVKRLRAPPDRPELAPGLSSSFIHEVAREGDILDLKAPAGHFYLDLSKHTPVVLVGGGIGLTPVLSMLSAICESGSRRETWLFYGVPNNDETIMREYLEGLARDHENVHLRICYSHPKDTEVEGTDYHHGEWISVDLFKRVLPSNNYEFFICGPPPMMVSLTAGLAEWGVPDDDVHYEAFGPASVKKPGAEEEKASVAAEGVVVEFAKSGEKVVWSAEAGSLLDFAEENGIVIDYGCRAGNCGTCVTAVKSGEVAYLSEPGSPLDEGSCLTCVAVPKTDLVLDA